MKKALILNTSYLRTFLISPSKFYHLFTTYVNNNMTTVIILLMMKFHENKFHLQLNHAIFIWLEYALTHDLLIVNHFWCCALQKPTQFILFTSKEIKKINSMSIFT